MKHSFAAAIAGLGLVATGPLFAQQEQAQVSQTSAQGEARSEVSEQEIQKFAEIYVEIEKTRSELSREMADAENEEAVDDIQGRMQDKIVSTIEDSGWSMAEYNQVAQAITNDPQLRQQALTQIQQLGT